MSAEQKIPYQLIRKKQKHTYIRITNNQVIVTTSHKTTQKYIDELILNKNDWILEHLNNQIANQNSKKKIFYLGKTFALELCSKDHLAHMNASFFANKCTIYTPSNYNQEWLNYKIDYFYKEKAKKLIPDLLKKWSDKMKLSYKKFTIKKTKTRWGSCSSDNCLSFNFLLMTLPLDAIEYVVIHELSHITHKNHSSNFWQLVEKHCPKQKEIRAKIRIFEKDISFS